MGIFFSINTSKDTETLLGLIQSIINSLF